MNTMTTYPVSTRLDGETLTRLKDLATRQERSLAWLLRKAAEEYAQRKTEEKSKAA
jgi:predicted transcriptional regulator